MKKKNKVSSDKPPVSESQRITGIRSTALSVLAAAAVVAASLCAVIVRKDSVLPVGHIIFAVCMGIALAMIAINFLGIKILSKRIKNTGVAQGQAFLLSQREKAEETAEKKLKLLSALRILTAVYAMLIAAVALTAAWSAGLAYSVSSLLYIPELALCWQLMGAAFTRIRFPQPASVLAEQKGYLNPQDYPVIYGLAHKAAAAAGHSSNVRILVNSGGNAGVFAVNNECCVEIGADLFNILTQDEMYTTLLHEFAHCAPGNARSNKELKYNSWIKYGITDVRYIFAAPYFFMLPFIVFTLEFEFYSYAVSINSELAADRAMSENSKAAASALTKLEYYSLFDWEYSVLGSYNSLAFERPDPDFPRHTLEQFKKVFPEKENKWKELAKNKILSRSTTHPTLMMRLENLGFSEIPDVSGKPEGAYLAEAEKAMDYMCRIVSEARADSFEAEHKTNYLEPLQRIEEWEKAGEPLVAEGYADIASDMIVLGRKADALKLYERAISELPAAASPEAYYMRGVYRLHSFDKSGIDDLYFAIENNNNYIEDALSEIGEFCVIMGMEDELEVYRQRAVEITQRKLDVYDQTGKLEKNDRISAEHLPEGMQEALLKYISDIAPTQLQSVYLCHKTITEDFFTSPVVLRFCKDVSEKECEEIYHKVFRYLDTSTDWQFSLFIFSELDKAVCDKLEPFTIYKK